jgi:hypothetical protein
LAAPRRQHAVRGTAYEDVVETRAGAVWLSTAAVLLGAAVLDLDAIANLPADGAHPYKRDLLTSSSTFSTPATWSWKTGQ